MSDKTLSQRLREYFKDHFWTANREKAREIMAIAQAEAQDAKEYLPMPTDAEMDRALETMPDYNKRLAQAIGEQTPVVIKDSEVFTACETYADNYLIEGRITTSPKAMRMALKKFMEGRSPMSSEARDKAIEALNVSRWVCKSLCREDHVDMIDDAIDALRG